MVSGKDNSSSPGNGAKAPGWTDPTGRREYNKVRPHSALGYRLPAPEAILPLLPGSAPLHESRPHRARFPFGPSILSRSSSLIPVGAVGVPLCL